MSWLSNLANSLQEEEDDDESPKKNTNQPKNKEEEEVDDPSRGVKEDLSELTKTLTRQLWGVASFLAPPPQSPLSRHSPPPPPPLPSDPARVSGIRSDFAEIGGRFRNEISRLSTHKAVSEISKIASTFLPFGSEEQQELGDYAGDAVGVTKEVLAFARNIAMHPETWLDFPLVDDDHSDDFDMSDIQQEHALAVEHLAPRLAALRIELCPRHMSEGCFWKIYFVLLHPRLNKHDAELLSTPQIVEARALLTQDLQNRTKSQELYGKGTSFSNEPINSLQEEHYSSLSNVPNENAPLKTFACDASNSTPTTDIETEKHAVVSTEMQIVDKSVVEEGPLPPKNKNILVGSSSKYLDEKYEDDGDDWLEDENSEMGSYSRTSVPLGNEEDVSFSDLEDDDDDDKVIPVGSKAVTNMPSLSSQKESQDWVQLNKNSTDSRGTGGLISGQSHANDHSNKDTNDWLDVDTKDVI